MNTIQSLLPVFFALCINGNYCELSFPSPPRIKYYESGKACYIEGIFYESCPKLTFK